MLLLNVVLFVISHDPLSTLHQNLSSTEMASQAISASTGTDSRIPRMIEMVLVKLTDERTHTKIIFKSLYGQLHKLGKWTNSHTDFANSRLLIVPRKEESFLSTY